MAGAGIVAALSATVGPAAGEPPVPAGVLELSEIGRYASGLGEGSAEIVAHDEGGTMFVVNAADASVDVVDISDPSLPVLIRRIDLSPFGATVTSVDVHDGVAVASVVAGTKTDAGRAVFFDGTGRVLGTAPVGALPDMVTFTPDGDRVLVANEASRTTSTPLIRRARSASSWSGPSWPSGGLPPSWVT